MTKAHAVSSRAWWVVDATGKPLGRLASEVARVLRGKHKPQYTPHEDTGDFVVIVNADKVLLTGNKLDKKFYYHHSGIPGGFQAESYRHLLARKPDLPSRKGGEGDAPQGRSRSRDVHQAQGLSDAGSPPRCAEAAAAAHQVTESSSWRPQTSNRTYATGKRKTAIARVWLKPGTGDIVVNGLPCDEYFERETSRMVLRQGARAHRGSGPVRRDRPRATAAEKTRKPKRCATASPAPSARSTPRSAAR